MQEFVGVRVERGMADDVIFKTITHEQFNHLMKFISVCVCVCVCVYMLVDNN